MTDDHKDHKELEDTNLARRKLLKKAAWATPAIVATVAIGTRHAIAWSCGPGPCGPEFCMPQGVCMPDRPCMPDLPRMPDRPCMPETCMPAG